MGITAEQYRAQLQALLPSGAAWSREPETTLTKFLAAIAEEMARLDVRAEQLVDEADPRITSELLPDWERVAGLPDPCVTAAQTTQERRAALIARLTNIGGQSRQFFIAIALARGVPLPITEFHQFQVGESAVGDALNGDDWVFTWRVNAPTTTIREFAVNESAVGDPLRSWGNEILECVMERLKPAHTHVIFGYS